MPEISKGNSICSWCLWLGNQTPTLNLSERNPIQNSKIWFEFQTNQKLNEPLHIGTETVKGIKTLKNFTKLVLEEELLFNYCKIHPEVPPLQPEQEPCPQRIHGTPEYAHEEIKEHFWSITGERIQEAVPLCSDFNFAFKAT